MCDQMAILSVSQMFITVYLVRQEKYLDQLVLFQLINIINFCSIPILEIAVLYFWKDITYWDLQNIKERQMEGSKSRAQIIKGEDQNFYMTVKNLQICNKNQDRYQTPELNDAFELHYYGFCNIANLQPYSNINTLYLNNNVITKIQNLGSLKKLVTLNLANNRISKIQNLEELTELFILDLSGNKIQKIQNMGTLQKLTTFNISSNLITKHESINQLINNKALTCLNLSSNPFSESPELYDYLEKMNLLTLYIKDTKFCRGIPSYRKETICRLKVLTFLDERPVTKDERMMAQAWKLGGLQAQKQARKLIQQSKDEKNRKIYAQMAERSSKIEKLRDQLFQKLTLHEHEQLLCLRGRLKQQKQKEIKDQFQISLLNQKIQQIDIYLRHFREDVNYMSVGQKPQVPNNLCERHQVDAIYIYGVTEEQLPKIKQKYYPDETRPLIAKDFQKDEQLRWVNNYDQVLEETCRQFLNKSQFILPAFNFKIHEFDYANKRKARRFRQEQIWQKVQKFTKAEAESNFKNQAIVHNELNELD